jgi:hypothetical protein
MVDRILSHDVPPSASRRNLLQLLLALTCVAQSRSALAGASGTPSARPFTATERATLLAMGETLLPGADLSRFVSRMFALKEPMLSYPYVSFPEEAAAFYRDALAAIEGACRRTRGKGFAELPVDERVDVVGKLMAGRLEGWDGPPSSLVYFVLRSDAIDAVYGSPETYEELQIPYMAHIQPPSLG